MSVHARARVCASYWKLMWCQWGVFKGRITFLHPSAATQRCDLHHHRCLRCWTPLQSVAHSQTDNVTRAVLPASLHFRGNILNFVLTLTALNGSNFTMLRSFRFHLRKSHVNHIHPVLWNPDDCSPRSAKTSPPPHCGSKKQTTFHYWETNWGINRMFSGDLQNLLNNSLCMVTPRGVLKEEEKKEQCNIWPLRFWQQLG